jgi:glycosyltransferase involved in cell wall biosynthesis
VLVTVAICTWNRAALLDRTLTRLRDLRTPPGLAWELLVVDNNCTDATPDVLARHAGRLPIRALREPRQGHSHARNRAVGEARGDLLLWTDDDVLAHPDWLAEHATAAERFPDAHFFGGPVRPWFEAPPPRWVERSLAKLGYCWALIDHGPEVRPLSDGEYGYGANLGFRTDELRKYPFDPGYGRVGQQLSSGDETRVIDRVRADGGTGVWVGTAAVDHFLPADRMTPRYVSEVTYWAGYHGFAPFAADRSARLCGAPRWLWKRYLVAAAKARFLAPLRNEAWVDALLTAAKCRGLIQRFRESDA